MAKKRHKEQPADIEEGQASVAEAPTEAETDKNNRSRVPQAIAQCFGCAGKRIQRQAIGFWERTTRDPAPYPKRGTPEYQARLRHLHARNHRRESRDNLIFAIVLVMIYAISDIVDQMIKPDASVPLFATLTTCMSALTICMNFGHLTAEGHHAASTRWSLFFNSLILSITIPMLCNSIALLALYHTVADKSNENGWIFGLTIFHYIMRAALLFPEIANITRSFRDATCSTDSARDDLADEELGYDTPRKNQ